MIKVGIIIVLAIGLLMLVRRKLIQVDMSFPWLAGLVLFGFFSTSEDGVAWVATKLGILYPPIAIVFVSIFILVGLITVLLIAITRLRQRQIEIVRRLAKLELGSQEMISKE